MRDREDNKGGRARDLAVDAAKRNLKLLPWGGVAARLPPQDGKVATLEGRAFCFLPLPVVTGLPVHVSQQAKRKSINLCRLMVFLNSRQIGEISGQTIHLLLNRYERRDSYLEHISMEVES